MNFDNKTVWITGASSGIGRALSEAFAARGALLVLSSRRQDELESLAAKLPGGASRHRVVALDLENYREVPQRVAAALAEIGEVDILVNNGGISQRALCIDTDISVYERLININYLGTVAMTKAVLPSMLARGQGSIVAVSSVAGKVGSKLRSGYSGSKFAVVGFMDCLRAETAAKGLHCLTVCPGSIKTAIAVNALTGEGAAQGRDDDSIINGMPVDICAEGIIRALEKRRDEVVIGRGISAWSPTIKRFFPGLFNRLSAKMEYR